jgi:hypothetical protein
MALRLILLVLSRNHLTSLLQQLRSLLVYKSSDHKLRVQARKPVLQRIKPHHSAPQFSDNSRLGLRQCVRKTVKNQHPFYNASSRITLLLNSLTIPVSLKNDADSQRGYSRWDGIPHRHLIKQFVKMSASV